VVFSLQEEKIMKYKKCECGQRIYWKWLYCPKCGEEV
jgi:uncharacterized OB-fold protein